MSLSDYHCGWLTVRIWGLDIHCLIYILVFCFPLALCLVHSVTIKFSPCLHSFLSKRSHILIKTFSVFMMRKKKKSKSFGPTYCFLPAIFFFFTSEREGLTLEAWQEEFYMKKWKYQGRQHQAQECRRPRVGFCKKQATKVWIPK